MDAPLAIDEHDDASPPSLPRPMRVVLFTDTLADVNGVSRFLRDVARHAQLAGRDLIVVTSTPLACPEGPNIINLPPLLAGAMPGYPHLQVVTPPFLRAESVIRQLRPDVVHISTPGPVGIAARRAARRAGIPLLGVYHTDFPAYVHHLFDDDAMTWLFRTAVRTFYQPFTRVFLRSAEFARSLMAMGIPCRRLTKLRPGTDTDVFHPRHRDPGLWRRLPDAEPISPTSVKVLSSCRVSVEKNLPMLVRVWREVHARCETQGVEAELIVVGDGPYRPIMERELRHAAARFLGFRHAQELSAIYASSDLLAFPSTTDTLGQVVMEAQASGLPVLVSDVGGPKEVTREGRTGRILSAQDDDAWVDALFELIVDPARRAEMGRAARAHVEGYSIRSSFDHFWATHEREWARKLAGVESADAEPCRVEP